MALENVNIYEKICGKEFDVRNWSFDESKLFKIVEDLKRARNGLSSSYLLIIFARSKNCKHSRKGTD